MKIESLKGDIENSFQIVHMAVEGITEILSDEFRRLGKRCTSNWLAKQGYANTDVKRANFLMQFKLWIAAFILSGNESRAELILNDVEIFTRKCRALVKGKSSIGALLDAKVLADLLLIRNTAEHLLAT